MGTTDSAPLIRACWLSWLAVESADQAEVVKALGLADIRETTWTDGVELVDEVAHDEKEPFSTVIVTPPIQGWILAIGPYFGLPYSQQTAHVTDLCRHLSTHFGKAQLFFHSEQNDGEAWLIAEGGRILRRWISEQPELALGEPFGVERRLLDAYGIKGKPEDLDLSSDLAGDWAATWGDCWATTVAEECSINPTTTTAVTGSLLVAAAPSFE
ncbi:hypothetical protein ACGFSG_23430 [Streptomyces sp. NPDC048512]|uniref:hypothetical protein n=1 Tax=unclassified Streptomyces TaxID=2593676 RepID=UPI00117D81D4|nr:hypothetical protein [Streptomyces sp. M41(2017)]